MADKQHSIKIEIEETGTPPPGAPGSAPPKIPAGSVPTRPPKLPTRPPTTPVPPPPTPPRTELVEPPAAPPLSEGARDRIQSMEEALQRAARDRRQSERESTRASRQADQEARQASQAIPPPVQPPPVPPGFKTRFRYGGPRRRGPGPPSPPKAPPVVRRPGPPKPPRPPRPPGRGPGGSSGGFSGGKFTPASIARGLGAGPIELAGLGALLTSIHQTIREGINFVSGRPGPNTTAGLAAAVVPIVGPIVKGYMDKLDQGFSEMASRAARFSPEAAMGGATARMMILDAEMRQARALGGPLGDLEVARGRATAAATDLQTAWSGPFIQAYRAILNAQSGWAILGERASGFLQLVSGIKQQTELLDRINMVMEIALDKLGKPRDGFWEEFKLFMNPDEAVNPSIQHLRIRKGKGVVKAE